MKLSPLITVYDQSMGRPKTSGLELALPVIADHSSSVFGDGSHPTTRLCAGAVDLLCRTKKPKNILDVGTGTGILARIARARLVPEIVATDIDALALESAQAHAKLDRTWMGDTIPEIELSRELPNHWGPRFDLIVANILEGPLRSLAPALDGALTPGGTLLLSGFTRLQVPMLRTVYESLGLSLISESTLDEWVILEWKKI
jgi:ribosomal protein L11 methyltransferase